MDSLKLGSAEFNISNYFIRNEYQYQNHYYIDSDNNYGDMEIIHMDNWVMVNNIFLKMIMITVLK